MQNQISGDVPHDDTVDPATANVVHKHRLLAANTPIPHDLLRRIERGLAPVVDVPSTAQPGAWRSGQDVQEADFAHERPGA